MLFEHKVFTTHQIVDLAFPTRRAANLRLLNLHKWGVLHRFQPHRDHGSHPMHYVLDTAGATLLAHEHGLDLHQLGYKREREIGRAYSLQLAHTTGTNSLFTTLIHHARQPGSTGQLTAWWSAARCGRLWGDIITPDAYGRWHQTGHETEWFLEFDFGTEQLSRLTNKITRYEQLATTTGITTPILVWLPTPQRETTARHAFANALHSLDHPHRVPVATTNPAAGTDPLDMTQPRWLRVNDTESAGRTRLADLPNLWPDLATPLPATPGTNRTPQPADQRPTLPSPHPMPPPDALDRRR
jgi:protein involved in plasmid replication-relaxation